MHGYVHGRSGVQLNLEPEFRLQLTGRSVPRHEWIPKYVISRVRLTRKLLAPSHLVVRTRLQAYVKCYALKLIFLCIHLLFFQLQHFFLGFLLYRIFTADMLYLSSRRKILLVCAYYLCIAREKRDDFVISHVYFLEPIVFLPLLQSSICIFCRNC